ncbi:restriction endonuclease subunit S [Oribacterium sp. P6A1]|uniref:restriction endonuclease subunit S n=1 Tax=Oribacterium sp. P6A1 TaxID=1410612 RepID=UPI0009DCC7F9|nr:restriction endonuclease subunit S [Oribacterium sp. P6A1]
MEYRLDEIFDLQMGKTPSRNNPEYWNSEDNKWISIADLSKCGKYIEETKEYLSDKAVNESGISLIPANTVIMSFKLSIGKTAITSEPMYSNEAIMSFRDKHVVGILPDYIYYMFSGKNWEEGTNKAVMGKTLNKATLSGVKVSIHDIERQREIVDVLDKLSSVIDNRQHELYKLDELIKVRFVELFGDLNINNMGWDEKPLLDVCNQLKRYPTFCNMEYIEHGTRVIRIGNILLDGHMDIDEANYVFVYDTVNDDFPDTVIEKYDIVMAVRGDGSAAKRIGIIQEDKLIGANISPNLIRIQANPNIVDPIFLFYYLTGEVGQKRLDAYVNKTAKKNIAAKDIAKVITPIPDMELQKEYVGFVKQVDKSKVAVRKALDETQKLFDSLMQEYFG